MKAYFESLNWISVLAVLVAIEMQIGNGSMSLADMFPVAWIPIIKAWMGNLGTVGSLIIAEASRGRVPAAQVPSAQPIGKAIVVLAVLAWGLFAFAGGAHAQGIKLKPLTGDVVQDLGLKKSSGGLTGAPVSDMQNFFNAKLLPDLQYALKLSKAANNDITGVCYQAWIDIITTQQGAVKNADGTDIAMPDPHIITEFEKLVELRNALQPESAFMRSCSPVASMVKKDIAGFIGLVISGGAGLATLVPGL